MYVDVCRIYSSSNYGDRRKKEGLTRLRQALC